MAEISAGKPKTPIRNLVEWGVVLLIALTFFLAVRTAEISVSPVLTRSMEPSFGPGDAVIYVGANTKAPKKGDVIVFSANLDSQTARPVVHRWVDTRPDGTIVTKGDANERIDPWRTTEDDILGTYAVSIPTGVLRNPFVIPGSAAALVFLTVLALSLRR